MLSALSNKPQWFMLGVVFLCFLVCAATAQQGLKKIGTVDLGVPGAPPPNPGFTTRVAKAFGAGDMYYTTQANNTIVAVNVSAKKVAYTIHGSLFGDGNGGRSTLAMVATDDGYLGVAVSFGNPNFVCGFSPRGQLLWNRTDLSITDLVNNEEWRLSGHTLYYRSYEQASKIQTLDVVTGRASWPLLWAEHSKFVPGTSNQVLLESYDPFTKRRGATLINFVSDRTLQDFNNVTGHYHGEDSHYYYFTNLTMPPAPQLPVPELLIYSKVTGKVVHTLKGTTFGQNVGCSPGNGGGTGAITAQSSANGQVLALFNGYEKCILSVIDLKNLTVITQKTLYSRNWPSLDGNVVPLTNSEGELERVAVWSPAMLPKPASYGPYNDSYFSVTDVMSGTTTVNRTTALFVQREMPFPGMRQLYLGNPRTVVLGRNSEMVLHHNFLGFDDNNAPLGGYIDASFSLRSTSSGALLGHLPFYGPGGALFAITSNKLMITNKSEVDIYEF